MAGWNHKQRMLEEHNELLGPVVAKRCTHVQIWPKNILYAQRNDRTSFKMKPNQLPG
jgi:hypothetical protein